MSDLKQEIVFPNSGLNTDDDYRYMQNGDGPYRLNIIVGEDGANGIITNSLGNTRTVDISDHELYLSHCYKVIGSYYNRLTRRVYYFVFSQPYEIPTGATASSTSSTTSTTTTLPAGGVGLDIDYTAGDFLYDNMLLCYYEDTQLLDVIFRDPKNYFGLHYNYPMRDICMIGNWLYFNPRISEPKMIDVEMAYNYTNYDKYDPDLDYHYGDYVTYYGGLFRANQNIAIGDTPVTDTDKWDRIGDSYQDETGLLNFDSEFRYAFNVIKMPPVARPVTAFGTDTSINSNNVRGKMFRFSYRYKYFDNSYSVYSAYSDVTRPKDDEEWNGEILDDVTSNNYVKVTVELHSAALVDSVEIIFQVIGEKWRRCKIINRQEQAELTTGKFIYNFYNNEAYEVYADNTVVTKVHDSVPKLANAQEIVNKNILCYGTVTEGFDNLPKEDIDVTLTPEPEDIIVILDEDTLRRDNITSNDIDNSVDEEEQIYYWEIDVSGYAGWGLANNDVYKIIVDGVEGIATIVAPPDLNTAFALVHKIADAVHGSDIVVNLINAATGILMIGKHFGLPEITVSRFYTPAASGTPISKYEGFKTGAFHPFCIFYYDENLRRWDSQTSKVSTNTVGYTYAGTTVYIPMFNEQSPVLDTDHRWIINWTVDHLPPDGAEYWRWGYAGNSLCSKFVQYVINGIADGIAADAELNMSIIDISPLNNIKNTTENTWNQFPSSNINPYTWEKGDRIRFITQAGDPTTPAFDLGPMIDHIIDMEIIKQVDNNIYVQLFDWAAVGVDIGQCSLVEIYSPLKETSKEEFYEFGALMPIREDSLGVRVHGSISVNQETNTNMPASGTFDSGDVYHIYRTPSLPLDNAQVNQGAFHESQWYSDFYDSDDWDKGKAGQESNFNERKLNIIRFSNPYFQNTQINGLPTFEFDRYKELNDLFGEIIAIYEVGDTLKCYQERKPSSIQMGRIERIDETGQISVSQSDVVLGSIRYSASNYSTVFPESISRNNKFIYGFDVYNGVMWRDGVNGIFPISGRYSEAGGDSDYKMATYFKDKSKALLVSGIDHCDVMTVWDEEFKNLHVVFVDYVEELNNETIVFHEPSNRWICFENLEQTPASYNVMLECTYEITKGFEGGIGYSFNEDTRFAIFDILTPGNKYIDMDLITMNMTPYAPSVQADADPYEGLISMSMTAYAPTVHVSYVHAVPAFLSWTGEQNERADLLTTAISNSDPYVSIVSIPTWITVENDLAEVLTVGYDEIDNEILSIYPNSINNTGVIRSENLVLTDAYGNLCTVNLTQSATSFGINGSIEVEFDSQSHLEVSATNVACTVGSAALSITFTPDHHNYNPGEEFEMTYTILKNGANVGSGSFNVNDELVNNKNISMSSIALDGDIIVVYLGATV